MSKLLRDTIFMKDMIKTKNSKQNEKMEGSLEKLFLTNRDTSSERNKNA